MFLGIATVVEEDADQQSIGTPIGDVESKVTAYRRETTRLHDIAEDIGANLGSPIAQFTETKRRNVDRNSGDQERDYQRHRYEWTNQAPRRNAGGVHHDDFGIGT